MLVLLLPGRSVPEGVAGTYDVEQLKIVLYYKAPY